MIISDFELDDEKSVFGQWFEYEDASFKIASSNTRQYRRALDGALRRFGAVGTRASSDRLEKAVVEAMSQTILLDWKNVFETPEKQFEFSGANAKTLLQRLPVLRDWIADRSRDVETFLKESQSASADQLKSGPSVDPALRQTG